MKTMKKLTALFAFLWMTLPLSLMAQDDVSPLWMRYPAISPDGETIVFSYKGDLYKVPSNGGTATVLTLHQAHDYMPVWSPDGKSIAFASNRYGDFDVFVMPAEGGEPQRLTYYSSNDEPSAFTPNGEMVLFSSMRLDAAANQQFPSGRMPELYAVPTKGGRVEQMLTIPAELCRSNSNMSMMAFQDKKGYEDPWRKHHTSSVTRDIWVYEKQNGLFTKVTDFKGEDRNPVFSADDKTLYYLSEESGSFNVHSVEVRGLKNRKQLTKFDKHPVRFLSVAKNGTLCFHYNGEIYRMKAGGEAKKVKVQINADSRYNDVSILPVGSASEFDVSSNDKEVVYIFRGEVFVSSIEHGTTKRITNTPEQERSVSFSPDGRSILYSSERDGSWNLYQTKIKREEEQYFFNSTILEEEAILVSNAETFQPAYSPDGKEVAFLEERVSLKVINLESKGVRTIMKGETNYSYSDGDQYYEWSPDGKWFLVEFNQNSQWIGEVGLIKADGMSEVINLSRSGYSEGGPKWMMGGEMLIWFSDRDGMKNHASWGGENDVYAMFLTQDAYDKYRLTKEEYELMKEMEKEEKKEKKKEDKKDKKKDKKEDKEDGDAKEDKPLEPIKIELDGIYDRKAKLTIHSSRLSDAVVDKEGETLYYLTSFEKGYDLWETNLRTRETKIKQKLKGSPGALIMSKDGKYLYLISRGKIHRIDVKGKKKKTVAMKGEMRLNAAAEREYLFEHLWRQVVKKFYREDLQGVDWDFYKKEYARFLPHINNGHDFAEMASELLGELNASHTGCRYRERTSGGDNTAALGAFIDYTYKGKGIKLSEIMKKGPLDKANSKVTAGTIIEKIDGVEIAADMNYWTLLNRRVNDYMLLSFYNPESGERWDQRVKPISRGKEMNLRYEHWVENCRKLTEKLSNGRVGYVHVKGMNNQSFKTVYEEALGRNYQKEALIVDTRFNGGGWLHDDLATFLSGEIYLKIRPRGQDLGTEPMFKWSKPSAVLMGEGNYSDAHMFPYTYKALGIGKLIGMPVAGTSTAVWWERMQNGMVFGIPQVGMMSLDGVYLENTELQPDVKVMNEYNKVMKGEDQQIEAAVKELLKEVGKK